MPQIDVGRIEMFTIQLNARKKAEKIHLERGQRERERKGGEGRQGEQLN